MPVWANNYCDFPSPMYAKWDQNVKFTLLRKMAWNPCHFYVGDLPPGCTGCLLCPNQIIKVDNLKGKELCHGSRVCSVYFNFVNYLPWNAAFPKKILSLLLNPMVWTFLFMQNFYRSFPHGQHSLLVKELVKENLGPEY